MDATAEPAPPPTRRGLQEPTRCLDLVLPKEPRWLEGKYQDLKATVKGYKNQHRRLTKSREQWRAKAEQAGERLAALEAEIAATPRPDRRGGEKKTDQGGGPLKLTPAEQQVPCGQQYAVGVVLGFVSLVLHCGASLRCAANVLGLFGSATGRDDLSPDRSTGRLWLLRIGLAALLRPKVIADDWVWMVDHSIQIGRASAWSSWASGSATCPRAGRWATRTWSRSPWCR